MSGFNNPSNYPPGVTGNEPEITGERDNSRRELTAAQIELLKRLRKKVSKLAAQAEEIYSALALGCKCDSDVDRCYVCALASDAGDVEPLVGRLAIRLDCALEDREFPEFSE